MNAAVLVEVGGTVYAFVREGDEMVQVGATTGELDDRLLLDALEVAGA